VAKLFGAPDPLRVIFTGGATAALNMAVHGLVIPGSHVLATGVEHNAAARPLEALRKNGVISLDWLRCAPDGSLDPETFRKAIRKETRLLVMCHASNVLGTLLPAAECYRIAREYEIFTILDTAQTAGVLPFTMDDCADLIAFAGHKGLGGLAGIGGFVIGERVYGRMRPWMAGGTGSASHSLDMPDFLPDRFEPGTQNTIGMLSLAASVEEIARTGVETIRARDCALLSRFVSGLGNIKNIKPLGTLDPARSVAVVSLAARGIDAGEAARRLFEDYGIITRSGLHCSPLAHKTAGTYPAGTIRFSFGGGTTEAEIDLMLEALSALQG
jgi:cysteine desulfurase family protein